MKQLLAVLALSVLLTCTSRPTPITPQAPIIFITIDTLRADRLPVYGYDLIKTPVFDAFAADSVLFERAFSQAPLTLPSHASLMTGLWPPNNGVRENVAFKLDETYETLAELLKAEGYATGAAVSSMVLRQSTGIAQGFDFYDDQFAVEPGQSVKAYQERAGLKTVERSLPWLAQHKDQPFFFWLHIYEPHTPYAAPDPFNDGVVHPYDGEIQYSDAIIGGFLDFLKHQNLYDDAFIALFSDHGEGLGDHGEQEHGIFTYREAIHVPLMIKLPGQTRAGEREPSTVALLDLFPTVLDQLGLDVPANDGVALLKATPEDDRPIYSEALTAELHYGWHASRSIVTGPLHYIEGHETQLYDHITDFPERDNLFGERKIPAQAVAAMDANRGGLQETTEISDEDKALLESLGYTGSFAPSAATKELSAEQFLDVYDKLSLAQRLVRQEAYDQAEQLLSAELAKYPGLLDFRILLGHALNLQKKYETAEFVLMEGMAVNAEHQAILLGLVESLLGQNKGAEAEQIALKALAAAPIMAGRKLPLLFFQGGEPERAAKFADRVRDQDPRLAISYRLLAEIAKNDQADTIPALRTTMAANPDAEPNIAADALTFVADGLARMGRYNQAQPIFGAAIQIQPDHATSRTGMAKLLASQQKGREAIQVIDEWVGAYPTKQNYTAAAAVMAEIGIQNAADFYKAEAAKLN